MNHLLVETTITLLGRHYKLKCSDSDIPHLQKAASLLEEKMRALSQSDSLFSLDKIVVVTALNMVHQLIQFEAEKDNSFNHINRKLQALQEKLESALTHPTPMQLDAIK